MDKILDEMGLREKLESFLERAVDAETHKNFAEAERLFRLALYCEGRPRPDVTDAREYVQQAGPVYATDMRGS